MIKSTHQTLIKFNPISQVNLVKKHSYLTPVVDDYLIVSVPLQRAFLQGSNILSQGLHQLPSF